MADINIAFNDVIKPFEGFYANVGGDTGGETLYGYARNKNSAAPLWSIVDGYRSKSNFPANMKDDHSIINLVIQLYKLNYWDKLQLDHVNDQRIANKLFDIAVNCGPATAGKFLQRILNVFNRNEKDYADITVDGSVGPQTISTLNNFHSPDKILKALNALHGEHYISMCERCPVYEKFINGWIERV